MGIRTHRFSARHVESDVHAVVREIEGLVDLRVAELARRLEPAELSEEALPVEQVVPHQPTWSAHLPACRTVLPSFSERSGLYGRLTRRL